MSKEKTEVVQLIDTGETLQPVNLLELWKQEADLLSSKLFIQQPPPLRRPGIDKLYNLFKKYFPESFFIPEKANEDDNWIHYLLRQHRHMGSVGALIDIGMILFYYEGIIQREPHLENKFNSLIAYPKHLRNFFFEIYTYRLLLLNKLSIEINPVENNQELEGYCMFGEQKFMFECLNLTIPYLNSLYNKYNIVNALMNQIQQIPLTGMIGIVKFNNPLQADIKEIFNKWIEDFVTWYKTPKKERKPLEYNVQDSNGIFDVQPNTQDRIIELEQGKREYDIWFIVYPPFTVTYGINNRFGVDVRLAFGMTQQSIQDKLERSLRKKRKQHKDRTNRIFFVNSEAINGLSMAIFQTPGMFDETQIQKHYEKKFKEDDILVFVLRNYTGEEADTKFKVFARPHNEHIKKQIESFRTKD